ncbi:hypothetical protein M8C21_022900, partial [Ambrosia artemisiifolia]
PTSGSHQSDPNLDPVRLRSRSSSILGTRGRGIDKNDFEYISTHVVFKLPYHSYGLTFVI